ncbi:thioredoxin [Planctomyces bekefii]|uniref:Thioredoxin n=1 Tax=Planctomyces bekefii TaxID=1653850 RepID=A0A5C6MBB3_9PLAN|nr:thioredoxin [Planctomyces bekefii]
MQLERVIGLAKEVALFGAIVVAITIWQSRNLLGSGQMVSPVELPLLGGDGERKVPASGRRTLVYFFAPWCGVCKVSANNLTTVYRWLGGDNVDVTAVALDYQSKEEVQRFAEEYELRVPIVMGNESVRQAFRVDAYPTYYVMNGGGEVDHTSVGYSSLLGILFRVLI